MFFYSQFLVFSPYCWKEVLEFLEESTFLNENVKCHLHVVKVFTVCFWQNLLLIALIVIGMKVMDWLLNRYWNCENVQHKPQNGLHPLKHVSCSAEAQLLLWGWTFWIYGLHHSLSCCTTPQLAASLYFQTKMQTWRRTSLQPIWLKKSHQLPLPLPIYMFS